MSACHLLFNFISSLIIIHSNYAQVQSPTTLDYFKIKLFTKYSLDFNVGEKVYKDVLICGADENRNATAKELNSFIRVCSNPTYKPRQLSSHQVSWKRNKSDDDEKKPSKEDNVTKKSHEIIHKYLAFALLLPRHPFSAELHDILRIVAPMFPFVTVVIGNGYEFNSLCTQYGVRSFPKLLLFKNGILTEKYVSDRTPETLALRFAKWTNSLPQAIPTKKFHDANSNLSEDKKRVKVSEQTEITKFFNLPDPGPSVEPVVGFFEDLADWDVTIFFISGVYALVRLLSIAYFIIRKRQ